MSPPADQGGWCWHTAELLASPAWRAQSIHCRKLIDFLELEHCHHSGQENGRLKATYNQLVGYGLSRKRIRGAIEEAEHLGLLVVTTPGGRRGLTNQASRYRLTYYGTVQGHDSSRPTDDWRHVKEKTILLWRRAGQSFSAKIKNRVPPVGTTVVPPVGTTKPTTLKLVGTKTAENRQS
ncbi:hypothetical protein [Kordiimonas sp.]|uniref:hypothetical protein n=1 Tax=Kordiimonas sp. TaxID=1970157 RepID=UPI003B51D9B8